NQTFDARGLPQTVDHGNGVRRRFTYDEENYRLRGVDTYSLGDDPATEGLQALRYVYDGVGNVTTIRDESQATRFFRNAVVSADQHFAYDAIYQLVTATGRESAARVPAQPGRDDLPSFTGVPHDNDATAVRRYRQEFEYDDFGNLLQLRHVAQGGAGSYTRRYQYAYQNDATDRTNRLVATNRPNEQNGGLSASEYAYDGHGNLTRLPGMDSLNWNYADRLTHIDLGGGGEVFYQYASSGKRVRKTIVRQGGLRLETTYLGNVERYREYGGGGLRYERETLQVSGVARVDTKRVDTNGQDAANPIGQPLIRYQYGDHQGSASLEVDAGGNLISYEQFHPFGTSAYRTFRSGADASRKRYRFAGRERDQESGLDYGGARYYAPWLGRWISTDPAGIVDGFNLYRYCRNNPVNRKDLNGMNSDDDDETPATRGDIIERSFDPDDLTEEQREALNEGKVLWNGEIMSREEAERLMEEALAAGRNVTRSTPAVELGEDNGDGGEPIDVTVDAGPQATPGTGGTETAPAPEADGNTAGGGEAGNAGEDGTLGSAGAAGTVAGPGTERFIWEHRFRGDGIRGKTRGFILQNMYTNEPPWRLMDTDNVPNYDNVRGNRVQQIKSTDSTSASYRRRFGSRAIRSARRAITSGQVTRPGVVLEPEAVVITRTDAPAAVADDFAHGANRARGGWTRNVQRVRGLPGVYGHVGRGLSVAGFGLSAYSLYNDIQTGDWAMGIADTLGTVGGGIELYAIAGGTGTTIAGASAMTVGVATAGVGLAIGSGISGYRAYQRGDTAGVAAGAVGVASGIAITAGIIGGFAAAPVVLAAGIVGAIGVGIFHAGRYFDWW
ncbi:MAG: RHS repeat-associated core domain-containing protein, partial [Bacteroidota bacterium]